MYEYVGCQKPQRKIRMRLNLMMNITLIVKMKNIVMILATCQFNFYKSVIFRLRIFSQNYIQKEHKNTYQKKGRLFTLTTIRSSKSDQYFLKYNIFMIFEVPTLTT